MVMGRVHYLDGAGHREQKNRQQDVHHKIHQGDIIVMDVDSVGQILGS
jgi:hypothetical protein